MGVNPYEDGFDAYQEGDDYTANPYRLGSEDWCEWHQGWLDAKEEG